MKKICLHIGVEKTGTTSIQAHLARNRDALRARGVLYPAAPGARNHTGLAAMASRRRERVQDLLIGLDIRSDDDWQRYREHLQAQLREGARSNAIEMMVLSNEHLSSRLTEAEELQALRNALLPLADEIQVILYARRQDEVILSDYSTKIQSGGTQPFRYLHYYHRKYNYHALAERWAGVFGRAALHCRVFDRQQFVGGDLLADFMACIGVQPDDDFLPGERKNESLSARALEYLRLLNQQLPAVIDGKANPERGQLARVVSQIPGERPRLDGTTALGILSLFAESNALFTRDYLRGNPNPFTTGPDPSQLGNLATLTAADSVELSAWLWKASDPHNAPGTAKLRSA